MRFNLVKFFKNPFKKHSLQQQAHATKKSAPATSQQNLPRQTTFATKPPPLSQKVADNSDSLISRIPTNLATTNIKKVPSHSITNYSEHDFQEALERVKTNGLELKNISLPLRNHPDIILSAVQQNGLALEFIMNEYKTAQTVLMAVSQQGWAIHYARSFVNAPAIVEQAIKENHYVYKDLKLLGSNLINEIEFNKKVLKINGHLLYDLPLHLKRNESLVKIAVQQNGFALRYAKALRSNKDIVKMAVQQNGLALEFAAAPLRANPDIVLAAVTENGKAIAFCDRSLREDIDQSCHIWIQALNNTAEAQDWLPYKFYSNSKIKLALETSVVRLNKRKKPINIIDNHFALNRRLSLEAPPSPLPLLKQTLAFHTAHQETTSKYIDEWAEKESQKSRSKSDNTITSSSHKNCSQ